MATSKNPILQLVAGFPINKLWGCHVLLSKGFSQVPGLDFRNESACNVSGISHAASIIGVSDYFGRVIHLVDIDTDGCKQFFFISRVGRTVAFPTKNCIHDDTMRVWAPNLDDFAPFFKDVNLHEIRREVWW